MNTDGTTTRDELDDVVTHDEAVRRATEKVDSRANASDTFSADCTPVDGDTVTFEHCGLPSSPALCRSLLGPDVVVPAVFKFCATDFSAVYAAQRWCRANGFSMGPPQSYAPIGLIAELDVAVAKWRNLTKEKIAQLDGRIDWENGGPRDGDARLTIFGRAGAGAAVLDVGPLPEAER